MTVASSAEAKRRERKRVKVKRERIVRIGLREPIGGLRERLKMEMELKWWW